MGIAVVAALALAAAAIGPVAALAEPVGVRFTEGVGRGFPVLRDASGEKIAQGDLIQVARGDRVENRLTFRFRDGSIYDETVVYSQRDVFTLLSYRLVQRGPSFPETMDAAVDRESGRYIVRYKTDDDSAEEVFSGKFEMPADAYNGLLSTLIKNLPADTSATVQIIAFTPKPRLVKMLLMPASSDTVMMSETAVSSTRFLVKPQLGLFASLLVADIPDIKIWVCGGEAPAFLRFEGPLYFMGPIWRIDWS
ncbi:MAG TPA: hypothetical protein VFQ62_13520 [Methylomirabilota bacterium]|nr:hypothetical protein [Methylomirabilota bacterium]